MAKTLIPEIGAFPLVTPSDKVWQSALLMLLAKEAIGQAILFAKKSGDPDLVEGMIDLAQRALTGAVKNIEKEIPPEN